MGCFFSWLAFTVSQDENLKIGGLLSFVEPTSPLVFFNQKLNKYMAFFNQKKEKDKGDLKEDFAKFFGPLMGSFRNLKNAGHAISGLSEATILYQLASSHLPIDIKYLLIIISIALTGLAVYIIEHGLSKTYSMWIRQIIRWKFGNKWFGIMFFILTLIVIPLLFASPTLSGWGGGEFVERTFEDETYSSTDSIETTYKSEVHRLDSLYSLDSLKIANRYDQKKKTVQRKYEAELNIERLTKTNNQKLVNRGVSWASGHVSNANKNIKAIEGNLAFVLDTLQSAEFSEIQSLDKTRLEAKQHQIDWKEKTITTLLLTDEERISKAKTKKEKWRSALFYLCAFAAVIVVISITVIELYRAGAGQEFSQKIDKDEQGKWAYLWSKLVGKWDNLFWENIDNRPSFKNMFRKKKTMQIQFKQAKKDVSKQPKTFETTGVSAVSVSETEAQIKDRQRKIKSYEWKLRNNVGKATTANKNIDRLTKEITNLKKGI